ncbi:MAG TPA: hypothetical protein VFS92_07690, partial [Planctomycetota bacterium]|nr:hypothetical protein [Planctomycetota bacterium]
GGAVATAAVVGFVVLGGLSAPGRVGKPSRAARPAPAPISSTPGPRVDSTAAHPRGGDVGSAAAAAPAAESAVVLRARELYKRIEGAAGRPATLPEDLQRDLLAFLGEGEANREALFRMVWDPGASRLVLGHLRLFLMNLEDAATAKPLIAALDSFDPMAGLKADVAAKSRDPSLLAAELRAMPAGDPKIHRIHMIPKDAAQEGAVKEFLLEAARDDVDPEVRSAVYTKLAEAALPEAPAIFLEAASDPGRPVRERQMAAYSIHLHPKKPDSESLFDLWDAGPDEVRIHLLTPLAMSGPSARVDDLLLETLSRASDEKFRKAATNAIGIRLYKLPAAEARDLGSRTAEILKSLPAEVTATALNSLGGVAMQNQPLREAIHELHRNAPRGGAIHVAIASSPALRMVVGL